MTEIKDAICRIEVTSTELTATCHTGLTCGTGFFISDSLILTCNHNLTTTENIDSICFILNSSSQGKLSAKIYAQNEKFDMALLEITEPNFRAPLILTLALNYFHKGDSLNIFGYPSNTQERVTGVNITATINEINSTFENEVKHDLVLNLSSGNNSEHSGLSGSPLLNKNNEVVAIFKWQGNLSFGGVSIKRASSFFTENRIELKAPSISFEPYRTGLFEHFNPQVITDCEFELFKVIQEVNPKEIVNKNSVDLFSPPKNNKSIDEIIQHIETHPECCPATFWKGWLKLLTYIRMIKGDYTLLNNITFTLSDLDFKALFGIENNDNPIIGNLTFLLSFYFVENDCFFDIAKQTLRKHTEEKINRCTIFNSRNPHFSIREFSLEDKHKIVPNIAGSLDDVFCINEKFHLGVLPLDKLSQRVANSSSLEDASSNLIKLFQDAIK